MYMPLMLMCLGMWLLFIQDSAHSTGGVWKKFLYDDLFRPLEVTHHFLLPRDWRHVEAVFSTEKTLSLMNGVLGGCKQYVCVGNFQISSILGQNTEIIDVCLFYSEVPNIMSTFSSFL